MQVRQREPGMMIDSLSKEGILNLAKLQYTQLSTGFQDPEGF